MTIELRLYATLAASRPDTIAGRPFPVSLPPGARLHDLLQTLGIASDAVHLIIVNGRLLHDRTVALADGDRVGLFPPVGGG